MKVTENSFRYYESKYTPSSIPIFAAYVMPYYFIDNKILKILIPTSIHIYNLCMSLYDRYTFPCRGDKILKFLTKEYTSEGQKYCFKSIQKDYGVSIIDIISVVGIIRLLQDTFQTHNSDNDIKGYMLHTVLGLTGLQMISGNPVTSVKVEYESVEENFLEEEYNDYINGDDVYSITSQDISASY